MVGALTITVFVGAARELSDDVKGLGDFFGMLNGSARSRGVRYRLVSWCWDGRNDPSKDYVDMACESELSIFLYFTCGGSAMEACFERVLRACREHSGRPRILTWFRRVDAGTRLADDLIRFQERLDRQLGHYFSTYETLDALKLAVAFELYDRIEPARALGLPGQPDQEAADVLTVRDGEIRLMDEPVAELGHIPAYREEHDIRAARRELVEVEARRDELLASASAGLLNEMGTRDLGKLVARAAWLRKHIETYERRFLDLMGEANHAATTDGAGSWQRLALRAIEKGDLRRALAALDPDAIEADAASTASARTQAFRLRAAVIAALPHTREGIGLRETALERAAYWERKSGVGSAAQLDYGSYLVSHNRIDEARPVIEQALACIQDAPGRRADAYLAQATEAMCRLSYIELVSGATDRAISLANRALSLLPADDARWARRRTELLHMRATAEREERRYEDAAASLVAALGEIGPVSPKEDGEAPRVRYARILQTELATMYLYLGQWMDACSIADHLLGELEHNRMTLNRVFIEELACTIMVSAARNAGDVSAQLAWARRTRACAEILYDSDPGRYGTILAQAAYREGDLLIQQGCDDEARSLLERASELFALACGSGQTAYFGNLLSLTYAALLEVYDRAGDALKANTVCRAGLALTRELAEVRSEYAEFAIGWIRHLIAHTADNEVDEVDGLVAEARRRIDALPEKDEVRRTRLLEGLAYDAFMRYVSYDDAGPRAVAAMAALLEARLDRARACNDAGNARDALDLYDALCAEMNEWPDAYRKRFYESWCAAYLEAGDLAYGMGDTAASERIYRRLADDAARLYAKTAAPVAERIFALAQGRLACALFMLARDEQAIAAARLSREILGRALEAGDASVASSYLLACRKMADAYALTGAFDRALPLYRECIECARNWDVLLEDDTRMNLANCCGMLDGHGAEGVAVLMGMVSRAPAFTGSDEEFLIIARDRSAALDAKPGRYPSLNALWRWFCACAFARAGHRAQARASYIQAIEIYQALGFVRDAAACEQECAGCMEQLHD